MSNDALGSVLEYPAISRIRRNHGLEHATLHILSQRHPKLPLAGHSDTRGFWILGDVSTEDVQSAVQEAMQRMQAGEHNLAVHPNCGTNFVTSGILASLAAFVAMFGAGRRFRDRLERLPLAASLATVALIISQPLGLRIQERVTTSGELAGLKVAQITPSRRGRMQAHRVLTQG
jgi:Domain of unknown function (DUF6391)